MPHVTMAEFARMKGVSRKTIISWRTEGRIVFVGKLVDVEATQARLANLASSRAYGQLAPIRNECTKVEAVSPAENISTIPESVVNASALVVTAAIELARLLIPHMDFATARAVIEKLSEAMRSGAIALACDDYPPPSFGADWSAHPIFNNPVLPEVEWQEIASEYSRQR